MRHRVKTKALNRKSDHRKAMIRNLITSLFLHGKVKTTDAKAKVLQQEAEKLVTRVKKQKDTFNAIRELGKVVFTEDASKKALDYITKTPKTSGFTRATKIDFRAGDNALLVQIDLISETA